MYLIVEKNDNNYTVLDTSDLVEEVFTREQLLGIIQSGITVYGTNEFCLLYNIPCTLIVRLYGEDKYDIKDYDGYLLRDYCPDYDDSAIQVLDVVDEKDSFVNYQVWMRLFECIREVNPKKYNVDKLSNSSLEVGYKVISADYLTVDLLSIEENTVYTCDFHTCLFIYFEENKSIEGFDSITLDNAIVSRTGFEIKGRPNLERYRASSLARNKKDTLISNSYCYTYSDLYCNWQELDYTFRNTSFILLEDINLPLYSLKSCINRVNQSALIPSFLKFGIVVDFKDNSIIFDNGYIMNKLEDILRFYKVLVYEDSDIYEVVTHYLELKKTKASLLNNSFNFEKYESQASNLSLEECKVTAKGFKVGPHLDDFHFIVRLKYGYVEVRNVSYDLERFYKSLWMLRLTHTGSCWFNFEKLQVEVGSMKDSNSGGCISNTLYTNLVNKAMKLGISYYNDLIIPLCVHAFSDTVIDIVCLIRPDVDENINRTGINVVSIPLIFLNGNFIEYNDCYKFSCLFQTLYLSKEVIENLWGEIYDTNMSALWLSHSRKAEKELYQTLYKDSYKALKSVLD